MSLRESINGTTAADKALLVILIALSLTGFILVKEVLSSSKEVSIEVDGKPRYRYSLDVDRSVRIESPRGDLTVEIKGKKVRVIEASCPNRVCEKQGWIGSGAIICLPNRISVIVGAPGKEDGGRLDAVTG